MGAGVDYRSIASHRHCHLHPAVVGLLGVVFALDYDKPESVRLAEAGAGQLMYFRSIALFVRLMLFVSAIVLYGDIFVPTIRLTKNEEALLLPTIKLMLHCIWMWGTMHQAAHLVCDFPVGSPHISWAEEASGVKRIQNALKVAH